MKEITNSLREGIKDLDPIKKVYISGKYFSLYESISAIQIDKENMDNFKYKLTSNYINNYEFTRIEQVFKFIREIMIRIFQHLIKATSLSQSLFANRLVNSNLNSIVITSTKIVYEGSLLLTQNSNYLLHEDYFLENLDSAREYYVGIGEEELLEIIDKQIFKKELKDVIDFLIKIKNTLARIRKYDYKSSEIYLKELKRDLPKIKELLDSEEDVEFFDVDLNRHLYVQVQTKPAEFMGFKDLVSELNNIFMEWEWLVSKVKKGNVDLWTWVEEFVYCFPNATTLGRAALVNFIFHANGRICGEFTKEELFGDFVWSWHGIPNLMGLIYVKKELVSRLFQIQELWIQAIQVMCHNASRRHRKFFKLIKEWDLQERICSPLDSQLSLSEDINYEIRIFGSVMFDFKLRMLIYYLMVGFQLVLYSDMEVCAVCFYLIYLFKRRREFLEDLQKSKNEPSLERLSLSSNSFNINLEILKCTASELFFHGFAYLAAYLHQKDIIGHPKSRLFSFRNQYRYRFKVFQELNRLPFQGFDLYCDFWHSLLKEKDAKSSSKNLFERSMGLVNHNSISDGFLEGAALVEACQSNISALDHPESFTRKKNGRYFQVSNGLFPHA